MNRHDSDGRKVSANHRGPCERIEFDNTMSTVVIAESASSRPLDRISVRPCASHKGHTNCSASHGKSNQRYSATLCLFIGCSRIDQRFYSLFKMGRTAYTVQHYVLTSSLHLSLRSHSKGGCSRPTPGGGAYLCAAWGRCSRAAFGRAINISKISS